MSQNQYESRVEVDIVRLDAETINDHIRSSATALQVILGSGESENNIGYSCEQCHKLYKSEKTLLSHQLLKHPKDSVEVGCRHCDKKYSSSLSLEKHVRYMHRYKHRCHACYRTFPTPELLRTHNEIRCLMAEAPCTKCGKTFRSRQALRNHTKYMHPEDKVYYCEICRRVFTSERGLNNHISTMHTTCDTACEECNRVFSSGPALKSHVLYKHTKDTTRCYHCHKIFISADRRDRHMMKFHSKNAVDYDCNLCEKTFNTSQKLIQHFATAHTQ